MTVVQKNFSTVLCLRTFLITFSHESQVMRSVLWSRASVCVCLCVCVSVCLSAAACPHYCTDLDVTWGSGRGFPRSCALLGGFAIGARVALLQQHNVNRSYKLAFISDIAVFVPKSDVKLQPTSLPPPRDMTTQCECKMIASARDSLCAQLWIFVQFL